MELYWIVAMAGLASVPGWRAGAVWGLGFCSLLWALAAAMLLGRLYGEADPLTLRWTGCALLGMAGIVQCAQNPHPAAEACLCACALALMGYNVLWSSFLLAIFQVMGMQLGKWLQKPNPLGGRVRFAAGVATIVTAVLCWPLWAGLLP